VRLHVTDGARVEPGVPIGGPQPGTLAGDLWRHERLAVSVVTRRGAPDDRVHPVAVRDRPRQQFEGDHGRTLTADVPVGARVESLALSVGAIIRPWEKPIAWSGLRIMLTPPAKATPQSPARSDLNARCTPTNEDEHAASTATLRPRRLSA
jgi:hypothetical protein